MSKIKISALGELKKKIKKEQFIELKNENTTAFQLVETNFGIQKTESRMSFVINERIQKGDYILQPNDIIVVFKMGGAG